MLKKLNFAEQFIYPIRAKEKTITIRKSNKNLQVDDIVLITSEDQIIAEATIIGINKFQYFDSDNLFFKMTNGNGLMLKNLQGFSSMEEVANFYKNYLGDSGGYIITFELLSDFALDKALEENFKRLDRW